MASLVNRTGYFRRGTAVIPCKVVAQSLTDVTLMIVPEDTHRVETIDAYEFATSEITVAQWRQENEEEGRAIAWLTYAAMINK